MLSSYQYNSSFNPPPPKKKRKKKRYSMFDLSFGNPKTMVLVFQTENKHAIALTTCYERPSTALSPNVYYGSSTSESVSHLFLHCSAANYLWNKHFHIFGESWVCPKDLYQFVLTKFEDFGIHKHAETL